MSLKALISISLSSFPSGVVMKNKVGISLVYFPLCKFGNQFLCDANRYCIIFVLEWQLISFSHKTCNWMMDHTCVRICSFVDIKRKISSLNSIFQDFFHPKMLSFKVYIFCGTLKGITLSAVILFFSQEPVNLPQSECVCFSMLSKDGEAVFFFLLPCSRVERQAWGNCGHCWVSYPSLSLSLRITVSPLTLSSLH